MSELNYTEMTFENTHEDLQLGGMLFVPEGEGPFPTAILIHGSGPSWRDSVWYLSVARHLQQHGIAVLLPDKRGCEQSEGKWIGANFDQLATDTLAAVEHVKQQNVFAHSTIGLIGTSQGGWIAPVVAGRTDELSFVVSMSGAAVTTAEQLLHEEINNIAPYTYTFIARLIAPLTTNMIKTRADVRAYVGFDPVPHWKKVSVPVFFAFGENDENVPVEKSLERIETAGLSADKVAVYPDGGHGIVDRQSNRVSGQFLQDLVAFIKGK